MTREEINKKIKELEDEQYLANLVGNDDRSYDLGCQICDLYQEIPEDK